MNNRENYPTTRHSRVGANRYPHHLQRLNSLLPLAGEVVRRGARRRRAGRPPPASIILRWLMDKGAIKRIPVGDGTLLVIRSGGRRFRRGELVVEQVIAWDESDSGGEKSFGAPQAVFFDEFFAGFAHEIKLSPERSDEGVVVD